MAILTRTDVCECDVCGWEWLPERGRLPRRCGNRKCRSLEWNTRKSEGGGTEYAGRPYISLEKLDTSKDGFVAGSNPAPPTKTIPLRGYKGPGTPKTRICRAIPGMDRLTIEKEDCK